MIKNLTVSQTEKEKKESTGTCLRNGYYGIDELAYLCSQRQGAPKTLALSGRQVGLGCSTESVVPARHKVPR